MVLSAMVLSAVILSAMAALILSPAQTATLLKQNNHARTIRESRLYRAFPREAERIGKARDGLNIVFAQGRHRYVAAVERVVDRKVLSLTICAIVVALLIVLLSAVRDALVNMLVPAAIRGLGQTNGSFLQPPYKSGINREEFAVAPDRSTLLSSS